MCEQNLHLTWIWNMWKRVCVANLYLRENSGWISMHLFRDYLWGILLVITILSRALLGF